jgi:hypothetical protein
MPGQVKYIFKTQYHVCNEWRFSIILH